MSLKKRPRFWNVFWAYFERFWSDFFQKTLSMYKNQFKKTSAFFERFWAFFERFLSVFWAFFIFIFFSEFNKNALKTLKKRKFEKRSKPLQDASKILKRFGAFWSVFKNAIAFFARHFFARVA